MGLKGFWQGSDGCAAAEGAERLSDACSARYSQEFGGTS
jgi:hypothetical protein